MKTTISREVDQRNSILRWTNLCKECKRSVKEGLISNLILNS